MTDPAPAVDTNVDPTGQDARPGAEQLGDAGKRALDAMRAERNAARRELTAAQGRLTELENVGKTELEKLTQRASAAETRVAELESSALRARVAATAGLPADLAGRLIGATEEELAADAARLQELVGGVKPAPAPVFDGGARPGPGPKTDMNALIRRAAGYS